LTLIKPWERGGRRTESLGIGREGNRKAISHLVFQGKIGGRPVKRPDVFLVSGSKGR